MHGRGLPNFLNHITHPRQEATVVKHGFADIDAEGTQLAGFSTKSRRVSEYPDWHRTVGRGHPAHGVTCDQRGACSQPSRSQGREDPGRTAADDGYVKLLWLIHPGL